MEVRATTKFVRMSPQKLREIVDAIKHLSPQEALTVLRQTNKKGAFFIGKTIQTALSNAKNNLQLKEEALRFKQIEISEGPVFKRYQPVSRGRAHGIKKRTSHIHIVLEDKSGTKG